MIPNFNIKQGILIFLALFVLNISFATTTGSYVFTEMNGTLTSYDNIPISGINVNMSCNVINAIPQMAKNFSVTTNSNGFYTFAGKTAHSRTILERQQLNA